MNIISLESSSRCVVSGFGKVAMHVLEKLVAVGAIPITVSGNSPFHIGYIGKDITCNVALHLLCDNCYWIPLVSLSF